MRSYCALFQNTDPSHEQVKFFRNNKTCEILGPVIFRDRGKVAEFAELPT